MSRMMAPKMDVIRFKEADVIVASGAKATGVSISGFADGTAGNGSVTLGSNTYSSGDFKNKWSSTIQPDLYNNFGFNFDGTTNYFGGSYSFSTIASETADKNRNKFGELNGDWEWNASDSMFYKKQ